MGERQGVRCLFCRAALRGPGRGAGGEARIRFAVDAESWRAWRVCEGCGRWNLAEAEERGDLIERLERGIRRHARLLAATSNIALLDVRGTAIVRIGPSSLPEQAWWRYGRTLRGRHAALGGVATRLGACAGGALAYAGGRMGPRRRIPSFAWDDSTLREALRWWRFGGPAWWGRSRCPHCNSVLRSFAFEDSWHAFLIEDGAGLGLGIPCTRCDPWSPERVFPIRGEESRLLLRRVLAYQNIAGAPAERVARAARAIEACGTAAAFARDVARRRVPLRRLGPELGLALEIALSDEVERRALAGELQALRAAWRREDAIARIVDEL